MDNPYLDLSPSCPSDLNMQEILSHKKALRRSALQARRGLSPKLRLWKTRRIAEQVLDCEAVRSARRVLLYFSLPEEVGTEEILRRCLARGQQVILPCHSRRKALCQVVDPEKDLEPGGSSGILEPKEHCPVIEPEEVDAFLVPGVAFDRYGSRVGFGGGYFDRILARRKPGAFVAALAFACQVFRRVPNDPAHDQSVECIFTENTVYHYARSDAVADDLQETQALAGRLAAQIQTGFRLGLIGPLGVGKTTLVRAVLEALAVCDVVTSPSFVLMCEYEGRIAVRHIDLYRMGDVPPGEEDLEMFLETLAEFPGAVLIEWADYGLDWLPLEMPLLRLDFHGEQGRIFALETFRWDQRRLHEVWQ